MASTQDEAFREIQLSGKQLVFLFMAMVVIGVVVFLMGVQVGRGVLAERGLPEAPDVAAAGDEEPPLPPASTAQGSDAPITANEKLSYAERLSAATPANEPLKAAAPEPPAPATPAASTEPAGTGYAIQVAALRAQDEAEAIATRLAAKGYPAYVVVPARGAPSVYRVRVGKYQDRREADTVAARLTKEEQFKPWVVR